jgi:hypothetical protein
VHDVNILDEIWPEAGAFYVPDFENKLGDSGNQLILFAF